MATATATEEIESAPAEGAEGAAEAKGGGKKKLIMIVGGVVGLLLVAGAGLYFTGMLDSLMGKKKEAAAAEAAPPPKPLVFFDLPDFLTLKRVGPFRESRPSRWDSRRSGYTPRLRGPGR